MLTLFDCTCTYRSIKHFNPKFLVKQKVSTPQLNHISMKLPPFPLLSERDLINPDQFCNSSTVKGCKNDYCACTHVLQVKTKSVVELVLVDEGKQY